SVALETCTGCGACAKACHSYLGTDDYFNIPAARAGLMRRVYKRHFTLIGKLLGAVTGVADLDEETLQRWVDYFYQCTVCRRCARFCPFGIDNGEIVLAGRNILAQLGIAPGFMVNIARNELEAGNNTGIPKPAVLDSCSFLEEELREETGLDIRIPVDKPDSDYLYLPSSSEMFSNVETLMGAAKLFHVLGINWTLSTTLLEAANYGFLFNLEVMKEHNLRMRQAAVEVGAHTVIVGECGHGWRVARMCSEGANGPLPFSLVHVLDFMAARLTDLTLSRLPLRATLHDSCNYARSAGLVDTPREIMAACVEEFVEMTPNREMTFCCGGGSGLLMEEMMELRMKMGKMKAEQIRRLLPLDYVALPCASCKAQVPLVLRHYGMEGIRTGGVIDLLGKALRL
ncbi:MAG: (Fe-S)-binding protein, partial [Desulfuromonadales bacterium]|nr:(Fe-S)-binding protein [Desulfuromonadales bacterium]